MCLLGEKLAENGRHNAVYYLNRFKTIDKLANGGNREIAILLEKGAQKVEMFALGKSI
ncbi:MAG: hypothetical protein IJ141_01495 [Lachnospiraceae bacterium]|nr:hypothetical protein [Lachnospiraceae bacterium]